MGILIVDSDFIGKWELAKSNDDNIDDYILQYEEEFLIDLLGQELFDLFQADLVNKIPVSTEYLKIYNPFTEKLNGYYPVISSKGMKEMLLGLIYFYYVRDNKTKQTMNGAVEQQTEVATSSNNTFLYVRYNKTIETYRAIQAYIIKNKEETYPTYFGIAKKQASFI